MDTINMRQARSWRGPFALLAIAMLSVTLLVFTSTAPATAATASLSGTQNEDSTVWWATQRVNTYAQNWMSFTYSSTSIGISPMVLGIRNPSFATASFAKTGTINLGHNGPFRRVSDGSYGIGVGAFYMTTYLGWSGCGSCGAITWSGSLYYSTPYP